MRLYTPVFFPIIASITLLGLVIFTGCNGQQSDAPAMYEGAIIPYLPITMNDEFELTSGWLYHNYPYGKTEFTEAEAIIIYHAISSFVYYGPNHPWQDEQLYGVPPYLVAKNADYKTIVSLITHDRWGRLAVAVVNDEYELWFTVDPDAFDALLRLINL